MELLEPFCQFFNSVIRYILLIIKHIFSYSPRTFFFRVSFIWAIPLISPYYEFNFL
nr:MAG TPA: hypothetical protein [Caudoviricetes sp.]